MGDCGKVNMAGLVAGLVMTSGDERDVPNPNPAMLPSCHAHQSSEHLFKTAELNINVSLERSDLTSKIISIPLEEDRKTEEAMMFCARAQG